MADQPTSPVDEGIIVESLYVRERNALVTRADFSPLFLDYYLHLADHHIEADPVVDRPFKELLAAAVLHAASRPWNEQFAWTLQLNEPLANFFVTCDNNAGTVTGTVFRENIRESGSNLLFAEVQRASAPLRRSAIDFPQPQVFAGVEHFYRQSEGRIGRFFEPEDEEYWLIAAQPDCDTEWLLGLQQPDIVDLEHREIFSLLEKRPTRWFCGCCEARMFEVLLPAFRDDREALFAGEDTLRMQCPRCGRPYRITREGLEAYAAEKKSKP